MDFDFIGEHASDFALAAWLTLRVGGIGIICAIFIGLACAAAELARARVLSLVASVYVELSRNTPLLVQLFFLYFGLPKLGVRLDSETCAIAGLAFLGGGYMCEAFRSGLEAVPRIQRESAASLGFSPAQSFFHVILPQAAAVSVPAFAANVIFLLKETSVFSAVALADLMYVAKDLIGLYYKTEESLSMLVISYLIILLPLSFGASYLERRLRRAGFGD